MSHSTVPNNVRLQYPVVQTTKVFLQPDVVSSPYSRCSGASGFNMDEMILSQFFNHSLRLFSSHLMFVIIHYLPLFFFLSIILLLYSTALYFSHSKTHCNLVVQHNTTHININIIQNNTQSALLLSTCAEYVCQHNGRVCCHTKRGFLRNPERLFSNVGRGRRSHSVKYVVWPHMSSACRSQ